MSKEPTKITVTDDNKVCISCRGRTNDEQLSVFSELSCAGIAKRSSDVLNTISLSASNMDKLGGAPLTLLNRTNGMYTDVVAAKADIDDDKIKISNYVAEWLGIDDAANDKITLTLLTNKTVVASKVTVQKIDFIKNDYIVMSRPDYDVVAGSMANFRLLSISNGYTGEEMIVKRDHIKVDGKLAKGEILLNKKQRTYLGLQTPLYLPQHLYDKLKAATKIDKEEQKLFSRGYDPETRMLADDLPYEVTRALNKLVEKYLPTNLTIRPALQSFNNKPHRFWSRLADFFVGKSTLPLVCRRPYDTDEGSDVVRMSKSNMKLLGIDNMDRVILRHKNKSLSVAVLEIDDNDMFYKENLPININNAIGIPVHLRKQLGITRLNAVVKVDRDTGFIFRKSINEQIVPILLTLFSVNVFRDENIWKSVLLSLLAVPIVVYFNLSGKRNQRGAK